MDGDFEVPCDLSVFSSEESDACEYVVLRGYNPGCTDKLGAIISTHDVKNTLVIRMNSAAAALRRWRYELTFGDQILCLGADIEEKRLLYLTNMRSALMDAVIDTPAPSRATTPTNVSSAQHALLDFTTDSDTAKNELETLAEAAATSAHVAMKQCLDTKHNLLGFTTDSDTAKNEMETLATTAATSAHVAMENCFDEKVTAESVIDQPLEEQIRSQPVIVTTLTVDTALVQSSPPRNYAPPATEGIAYRPHDLPSPVDVTRGSEGRFPWYVAKKSRAPGIYASWEEAYNSNRGSWRRLITKGVDSYAAAISLWVNIRTTNEVRHYS